MIYSGGPAGGPVDNDSPSRCAERGTPATPSVSKQSLDFAGGFSCLELCPLIHFLASRKRRHCRASPARISVLQNPPLPSLRGLFVVQFPAFAIFPLPIRPFPHTHSSTPDSSTRKGFAWNWAKQTCNQFSFCHEKHRFPTRAHRPPRLRPVRRQPPRPIRSDYYPLNISTEIGTSGYGGTGLFRFPTILVSARKKIILVIPGTATSRTPSMTSKPA